MIDSDAPLPPPTLNYATPVGRRRNRALGVILWIGCLFLGMLGVAFSAIGLLAAWDAALYRVGDDWSEVALFLLVGLFQFYGGQLKGTQILNNEVRPLYLLPDFNR